jgi:hypothetical protein
MLERAQLRFARGRKVAHGARPHLAAVYFNVEPGHRIVGRGDVELHRERAPVGMGLAARIGDVELGRRVVGEIASLKP